LEYLEGTPLALAVKLVPREAVQRMPTESAYYDCQGSKVPLLSLHAFDSSTQAKIRLALRKLG